MKSPSALILFIAVIFVPALVVSARPHSHHGHHHQHHLRQAKQPNYLYWERIMPTMNRKRAETLQIAGSSLPDCSHACGSCSPCRLVMVSFVCASLEEAETCPMAYKCMCRNKSYPVP